MKWQLSVLFSIIQLNVLDGLATTLFQGHKNKTFVPLSESSASAKRYQRFTLHMRSEALRGQRGWKGMKAHVQTYSTAELN